MITGAVAKHELTVVRAPLISDGRGNLARNWAAASRTSSKGWALDVGNTIADTANRDGSAIQYTARGPFTADIDAGDRIELFGDTYEVDGGVRRQPGPSPLTSHTILLLTSWKG